MRNLIPSNALAISGCFFKLWLLVFAYGTSITLTAQVRSPIPTPVIPVHTSMQHWDNHWFVWLPKHPVYEAVEVMSNDAPNGQPLVWVFFTERAGTKTQIHYYNDHAQVRAHPGSFYRQMKYQITGNENGKSVNVSLTDKDDSPVDIAVTVNPAKPLTKAGLTDQSGHSAASFFLIFFRDMQLNAENNRVILAGKDLSFNSMVGIKEKYWFMSAYSKNIFVVIFPFATAHIAAKDGVLAHTWGWTLTRQLRGGQAFYQSAINPGGVSVRLDVNAAGDLTSYIHQTGDHQLNIRFGQPLVVPAEGQGYDVSYQIGLDHFNNLVDGSMHVSNTKGVVTLIWNHRQPEWAREYTFVSTLTPDADGAGYLLVVGKK